jgi:probable phosphoglycerate mutase
MTTLGGLSLAILLSAAPAVASEAPGPAGIGRVPEHALRAYLVRHGQSFSNLKPLPALSAAELDRLTELGRLQSRAAGVALRGCGVAAIVSSPRGRTRETAEQIRAALGDVPVRVDDRLRSLEFGVDAAGKPLSWDDRYADWKRGRDPAPALGESLEQLGLRVLQAFSELKREFPGRAVVLVSHSEVISNFLGMIEADRLDGRFDVSLDNGSISAVQARPASVPRLLLANFVPQERPAAEDAGARAAGPVACRLEAP